MCRNVAIGLSRLCTPLTLAFAYSSLGAQVPAVPVLQNAFLNPGLGIAANVAGGGGQSFYGLAAGWGLGGGRFLVSGAAGALRAEGATRGAYGGRVAATVWSGKGGSLGAGAFAGVGGAPGTRTNATTTSASILNVPVGVTVGYRRALGTKRGLSAYVSPLYRWTRADDDGVVTTSGTVRAAFGMDFSISPSIGATVGGELGRSSASRRSGTGTLGAAVTFVPGRR